LEVAIMSPIDVESEFQSSPKYCVPLKALINDDDSSSSLEDGMQAILPLIMTQRYLKFCPSCNKISPSLAELK